jgi:hypothetical protein
LTANGLFFIGCVACLPFYLSGGFSNGGLSDGCLSGLWSAGFRFWCWLMGELLSPLGQ